MKSAIDRLREKADDALAQAEADASEYIAAIVNGTSADAARPWTEATVRDKMCLALSNYNAARGRARINANAGPKTLGVIVVPAQMTSAADWEAKGRELAAKGRKVIDTTAGPAELPAVEEKK